MTLRLGNKKVCPTKLVKVNNVDFSKIGLTHSRNISMPTDSTSPLIFNGRLWISQPNEGFFPRGSAEENQATKVVNFSQPFEIHAKITAPTYATNKPSCVFGNCYSNQYCKSPECTYTNTDANNTFWFGLSTDGQNWTYTQSFSTSEVPKSTTGEIYEVTSKYTGSKWIVAVTFNGETVTKSLDISGTPYYSSSSDASGSYFCFGNNAGGSNMSYGGGWLYLDSTYIKQNDVLVWGCEEGQNYIEVDPNNYLISNVTKVGAIEDDKGLLSGFTNSNIYAYTNSVTLTEGSEINISFIVPVTVSADSPILSGYSSNYIGDVFIGNANNKIWIWDGSNIFGGSTVMSASSRYSFKLVKNSSNLLDMYLKEGLPTSNISDYTLEFSNATDIISGNQIRFGVFITQSFNGGSIDLNNCYIDVSGQTVWQGVVPQGTRS